MDTVSCYSGSRYPERPVSFEVDGVCLLVDQIQFQARTEEGWMFRIVASDGHRYRLEWNETTDSWVCVALGPAGHASH